jgi:hypothetical protein
MSPMKMIYLSPNPRYLANRPSRLALVLRRNRLRSDRARLTPSSWEQHTIIAAAKIVLKANDDYGPEQGFRSEIIDPLRNAIASIEKGGARPSFQSSMSQICLMNAQTSDHLKEIERGIDRTAEIVEEINQQLAKLNSGTAPSAAVNPKFSIDATLEHIRERVESRRTGFPPGDPIFDSVLDLHGQCGVCEGYIAGRSSAVAHADEDIEIIAAQRHLKKLSQEFMVRLLDILLKGNPGR